MKEKMRTIGYLCPRCRKPVMQQRSRFALAASGAIVQCECGKSELQIDFDGEKFRISVPCGVCGGEHLAECSAERLLDGEGIGLACPETSELCCFIGEEYAVERALAQLQITAEKQSAQGDAPEAFTDTVIMYEVLSELKEIAARPRGITCACGSARYRMQVPPAAVDLICADCGATLRLGAATHEDLDRLCSRITPQIPGKTGSESLDIVVCFSLFTAATLSSPAKPRSMSRDITTREVKEASIPADNGMYVKSLALATAVIKEFCTFTGAQPLGIVSLSDQTGFNYSDSPVIAIEMGCLSNEADDIRLNRAAYQDACAFGVYRGINQYAAMIESGDFDIASLLESYNDSESTKEK